jgi:hypothetical protein
VLLQEAIKSRKPFSIDGFRWLQVCGGFICDMEGFKVTLIVEEILSNRWIILED